MRPSPPRFRLASLVFWLLAAGAPARPAEIPAGGAFDPGRAGFEVRVRGELSAYRFLGVYALPGETLRIEVPKPGGASFRLRSRDAVIAPSGTARWAWRAPAEPGLHPLEIARGDGAVMVLNVFVMVPSGEARGGYLRGYRLGEYPEKPLGGLPIYRPPRGFVLVTPENESTPISPHFTLQQFLCKQAGGYPKLVALRERLLLKLELLLQLVNDRGWRCDTFAVLSGFRTPFYNRAIGNVPYSRHQWGGAADVFIDERPRDGVMDDLDGNGVIDERDADVLYDLFEGASRREHEVFAGGLGSYGQTGSHGPFVHVDTRGFRARWGR